MESIPKVLWVEVIGRFKEYQTVYLATADGPRPRVRPVTLAHLDGRFWVLTRTEDAKVAQVQSNPNFEFCLPFSNQQGNGYVRVAGKIEITREVATRRKTAQQCEYFGKYWKSPDDATFTLLELGFQGIEYLRPGKTKATRYRL